MIALESSVCAHTVEVCSVFYVLTQALSSDWVYKVKGAKSDVPVVGGLEALRGTKYVGN